MTLDQFLVDVWPKIESKYKAPADITIDHAAAAASAEPVDEPLSPTLAAGDEHDVHPAVEVGDDAPQPTVETLEEEAVASHDDIPEDQLAEGLDDVFGGSDRREDEDGDDDDDKYRDDGYDEEDDDDDDGHEEDLPHRDDEDVNPHPPSSVEQPPTEFQGKDDENLGDLVKPDFDEDAKSKIAAAEEARSAFNAIDDQFRGMEKEIHAIEKIVGLDLGRFFEFAPLHGKCLEYTDREYIYKVSFIARQVPRVQRLSYEVSLFLCR